MNKPSLNRRTALVCLPGVLVGCAFTRSTVEAVTHIPSVQLWGIARGMGEVVLGAIEVLAPGSAQVVAGIQAIIDAADPLVATASTSATDAAQLVQHANALMLAAAPDVHVKANV